MIAPRAWSEERLTLLLDAFAEAGCELVEPPVLQPAAPFVDTAGEDLAGRLFTTQTADGRDLCLRPDYTIPVCRAHLDRADVQSTAAYAYCGPVFRQRPREIGEFLQAGAEFLGDTDRDAADARALTLALEALEVLGSPAPEVAIGDESLFASVVDALGITGAWHRRLRRAFGDRTRLDAVIAQLAQGGDMPRSDRHAGVLGALAGSDHDGAVRLVEDLIAIAGVRAAGGRTAHEIAERFLDQAMRASAMRPAAELGAVLRGFLAIGCPADEAADRLGGFAERTGLDLSAALAAFRRRLKLAAGGIAASRLAFSAEFGRNLDYYTGFVFEMRPMGMTSAKPIVGGGRYDGLLTLLGAPTPVSAVGFSLWLDRLGFGSAR